MTIKAIRKSKTTAVCPDCGKQHKIHKVSVGEYIKGCIYPCPVYWIEDSGCEVKPLRSLPLNGEGNGSSPAPIS